MCYDMIRNDMQSNSPPDQTILPNIFLICIVISKRNLKWMDKMDIT